MVNLIADEDYDKSHLILEKQIFSYIYIL